MTNEQQPKKMTMAEWLAKQKAERLKRQQIQWQYEDESGETEAAIERYRESRYED
jgi:hypothetical protein